MRFDHRLAESLAVPLVVAAVAAGCGPPAELRLAPPAIDVTTKLSDDPKSAPTLTAKVAFQCSKPGESLGWTLSGAPPWATPSSVQGGTPADVEVRFDLAGMVYGENTATLVVRHGEIAQNLAVKDELRGQLKIGPTQSVSLRGVAGEAKSSIVKLALDSPGKPGLHWRAKTDDPWIVVEPSEGVTPATVAVSGTLDKAASNASGRIEFTADSTWKGSPTVIPAVIEILNPDAIKKQIDAKLALLTSEREDAAKSLQRIAGALKTPRGVDAVMQTFRDLADRASSASKKITSLQQDLLGFLEQNAAYEKVVSFDDARTAAAKEVTAADTVANELRRSVDGMKIQNVTVNSAAEWQQSGMKVNAGDLIAFEASGSWHMGPLAGNCGPQGRTDGGYRNYCVDAAYSHGCLLLRVGDAVIADGAQGFVKTTAAGRLDLRSNDQKYTDNSGSMSLRVAIIPAK